MQPFINPATYSNKYTKSFYNDSNSKRNKSLFNKSAYLKITDALIHKAKSRKKDISVSTSS